ncbi:hypothetical protein NJB18091_37070 [Mycobacterium marinum]|uniref:helix-turn-helix domain-containing protein n=1 Tax=Mycobacterium marinum TaxID=1781 RepID=UPI0021C4579E|nr:hypothetical protein [Mycobacterium marinum]GJO02316.1 hypothetical protein NJB18091_37070 [Mycobacterium marinum]
MSAELVETVAAEVVTPPMDREDAEKLDRRIRNLAGATKGQLDSLGALVAKAKVGRIHEALGYRSWTAYLGDALRELCSGEGIEVRREIVACLHDAGMPQRAMAAATGVNQSTISRDLQSAAQVMHDASPDSGDDGTTDLARALQPAHDVHDVGEVEATDSVSAGDGAETEAKMTTGRDGKSYKRDRQKRAKGQGQRKKPKRKNHAEVLYALLAEYLKPAVETLDKGILDPAIPLELAKLDGSVTSHIATELLEDFDRDVKTFGRVQLLLRKRAGEAKR